MAQAGASSREAVEGFWQRDVSHYPEPITPMTTCVLLPAFRRGFRRVFDEFSLLVEDVEWRIIDGYNYQRVKPYGSEKPLPEFLQPLWRLHPRLRARVKGCVEAVRRRVDRPLLDLWDGRWRSQVAGELRELRSRDLAALDDRELLGHVDMVLEALGRCADTHFLVHGGIAMPVSLLAFFCHDRLGYDDAAVFQLYAGLSPKSTEPALRLAQLAERAKKPPLVELLRDSSSTTLARLRQADADFARLWDEYIEEYGWRILGRYDLSAPMVRENLDLLLGTLRHYLVTGFDPAQEQARLDRERQAAVEKALARLPDEEARRWFVEALAEAQRAYPFRDDNVFYAVNMSMAVARHVLLEVGRRLVAAGVIAGVEDVFALTLDEARDALLTGAPSYQGLVASRQAAMAQQRRNPPPEALGKQPPMPSFKAFPQEVQLAMRMTFYYMDKVFALPDADVPAPSAGTVLQGYGASAGIYSGPARVVLSEQGFDGVQPGDVLVCPMTSPVWSVLFPKVSALVTDSGGVLSHPAIIAREFGIPAVVGTRRATTTIVSGQTVLVDGDQGRVLLL